MLELKFVYKMQTKFLFEDEKNTFEENEPGISKFIKKVIGGEELLKGHKRYCFWIDNKDLDEALSFNEIARRVEQVKNFRVNGGDVAKTLANRSHQFLKIKYYLYILFSKKNHGDFPFHYY